MIEHLGTNPAELALPYTGIVNNKLISSAQEEQVLTELDHLIDISGMDGTYFTQTMKALAIPVSFEISEPLNYVDFNSITFEGKLVTYSIVKIGRIIGATSVRALCLTFTDVLLLPLFDNLADDQLLHVPALAVNTMSRTDV